MAVLKTVRTNRCCGHWGRYGGSGSTRKGFATGFQCKTVLKRHHRFCRYYRQPCQGFAYFATRLFIPGGEEMIFRTFCVAVLLSSLPIMGCGTVANLASSGPIGSGMTPFGGVHHDVEGMQAGTNIDTDNKLDLEQPSLIARRLLCAADLPFSCVGDVVTWPYVAAYAFINDPIPIPPVGHLPTAPVTPATEEHGPHPDPVETTPVPRKIP